mmetsp:Transcript_11743/g.18828  ORF Transcript_11743/g.18828 Transcript_11743/m.18828 type:complete len:257 (-) Transcript_11743:257-1027(-)
MNDSRSAVAAGTSAAWVERYSSMWTAIQKQLRNAQRARVENERLKSQLKNKSSVASKQERKLRSTLSQLEIENKRLHHKLAAVPKLRRKKTVGTQMCPPPEDTVDTSDSRQEHYLHGYEPSILGHSSKGGFTEYCIEVRSKGSGMSWRIYTRYSLLRKLHQEISRIEAAKFSGAVSVEFPPKKLVGNMNESFVKKREEALQMYLDALFFRLGFLEIEAIPILKSFFHIIVTSPPTSLNHSANISGTMDGDHKSAVE